MTHGLDMASLSDDTGDQRVLTATSTQRRRAQRLLPRLVLGGVPAPSLYRPRLFNTCKQGEKCAHHCSEHTPTGAGADEANAVSHYSPSSWRLLSGLEGEATLGRDTGKEQPWAFEAQGSS